MTKRILIADDSRTFRHLQETLLRRRGYELTHAEDGAQCVKAAVEQPPDLILLDLQMPVMDGAKALKVLKENEKTRDVPVVIVTTQASERENLEAASGFISKPIDGSELLGTIRRLIG